MHQGVDGQVMPGVLVVRWCELWIDRWASSPSARLHCVGLTRVHNLCLFARECPSVRARVQMCAAHVRMYVSARVWLYA